MIMADVLAVFGTLLAMGLTWPGLLLSWRLLLPTQTDRAQQRLTQTPWRCFFGGLFLFTLSIIPILILLNLPWAAAKFIGFVGLFGLLAVASLGSAGLAALMGARMQHLGDESSTLQVTLRGAVAMALATAFPLIGWFVFLPLSFMTVLGAAGFALLGWLPRSQARNNDTHPVTPVDESLVSA